MRATNPKARILLSGVSAFTLALLSHSALSQEGSSGEKEVKTPSEVVSAAASASASASSVSPTSGAATEGDLFQKVFGSQSGDPRAAQKMLLSVFVDDAEVGKVRALIPLNAKGKVRLNAELLRKSMDSLILSEILAQLKSKEDKMGYVPLDALSSHGIMFSFDQEQVALKAEIPLEKRKIQSLHLRSRRPNPSGEAAELSTVSGVLNMAVAQTYLQGSSLYRNQGRQPAVLNLQGATSLGSLVFEGDGNVYEKQKRRWVRNDMRLVKDIEPYATRLSAGDARYGSAGLQSAPGLMGLSATKVHSIRPYDQVQSTGTAQFTLTSSSKVEFFVNNQLVDTRNLGPGTHRLSDFPVSSGANDIMVRITDQFGRVEEIKFPFFYGNQLLAEGVHNFSYTAGYLSENRDGVRRYDRKNPAISFMHQYGLTSNLTVGLNAQGTRQQKQFGAETAFSTPVGVFQVRGAKSQIHTATLRNSGHAAVVQYDVSSGDDWNRYYSLQWSHQSRHFSSLGFLTPSIAASHRVSSRYSQKIFKDIYASISGTYTFYRQKLPGENSQGLTLSKNLSGGWYSTLEMSRQKLHFRKAEQRLMVGLRWSIPSSNQSISTDYDSQGRLARTGWNGYQSSGVHSVNGSVEAYRNDSGRGVDGSVYYTGNRFTTNVRHDVLSPRRSGNLSTTTMSLQTALVFADGHVALSRPIYDSFVMVVPKKALKGKKLLVNPTGDGYKASTDILGPAVLPDVSSYYVTPVTLDRRHIPVGVQIDSTSYYTENTYRRGSVIRIGSDATIMARGQLVSHSGADFGLCSGELIPLDNPEDGSILFFTNRKGKFVAEGLKPGRYRMVVFCKTTHVTTLEFPQDAEGMIDLKEILLQERPSKLSEGSDLLDTSELLALDQENTL